MLNTANEGWEDSHFGSLTISKPSQSKNTPAEKTHTTHDPKATTKAKTLVHRNILIIKTETLPIIIVIIMLQDSIMQRKSNQAMSVASHHSHHFFHPIHTTASEDLWQLPHHSTASDLDHFGENQQIHRSWSSEEQVVMGPDTIPHPPTTVFLSDSSSQGQHGSRHEDEPPRRCPLGERTNTLKRTRHV